MLTDERALELWSGPGNRPVIGKYKVIAFARAIEAEVMAEAQGPAKVRFDALMGDENETPIERLRFFCSLAMAGQDWLDVEPFFEALTAPQPPAPCPKCENDARRSEYWKAEHLAGNAVITELQAKVAEQVAEIERLQSKLDLLVIERDAQAVLISDQQDDVEKQTEISNNFAAQVRQQDEIIASLRAEVDHRQSLLRESNRNCAEHADVVWTRNVTIAQQAERIAALEADNRAAWATADRHLAERGEARERIAEQAALIEKCEKALRSAAEWGAPMQDAPKSSRPEWFELVNAALAAIAAMKGGA